MIEDYQQSVAIAKVVIIRKQSFAQVSGINSVLFLFRSSLRQFVRPVSREGDDWDTDDYDQSVFQPTLHRKILHLFCEYAQTLPTPGAVNPATAKLEE